MPGILEDLLDEFIEDYWTIMRWEQILGVVSSQVMPPLDLSLAVNLEAIIKDDYCTLEYIARSAFSRTAVRRVAQSASAPAVTLAAAPVIAPAFSSISAPTLSDLAERPRMPVSASIAIRSRRTPSPTTNTLPDLTQYFSAIGAVAIDSQFVVGTAVRPKPVQLASSVASSEESVRHVSPLRLNAASSITPNSSPGLSAANTPVVPAPAVLRKKSNMERLRERREARLAKLKALPLEVLQEAREAFQEARTIVFHKDKHAASVTPDCSPPIAPAPAPSAAPGIPPKLTLP
jgi:hypothetical protein